MLGSDLVPTFDGLHVALSHFPIVLLLVAPVFVVLALLLPSQRRTLMLVAFGLLAAGTVAVYLAAASGDEAKEVAPQTPEVTAAVDRHESLSSALRAVATGLTVLLAGLVFGPGWTKRELDPRLYRALVTLFLVASVGSTVLVVGAARSGGELVHKLGVHARL